MTSTPFTTRLVTSPSITASCMITPIRRVLFRLHSRNSAPSMSSSTYRFMLGRLSPAPDIRNGHRAESGDALPVDTAGMLPAHEWAVELQAARHCRPKSHVFKGPESRDACVPTVTVRHA